MITFYPGPSKVYPQVGEYMQDAFKSSILSSNHRSEPFMKMLRSTIELMKEKLDIPVNYEICFVSSATECWEIVAQSLATSSFHYFNGAFGEKWSEYTAKLIDKVAARSFDINSNPSAEILSDIHSEDIVCFTHNETSNGTAISDAFLKEFRAKSSNIIAVDATSSMAGVTLPWDCGDVWYASVQKCFGLPAGMGVMILSPRAIERAIQRNENNHYNSLLFVRNNFLKFQTPYTPNILGIYLMKRVMDQVAEIRKVDAVTKERAKDLYSFFTNNGLDISSSNSATWSDTVLSVKVDTELLKSIKTKALAAGITLGNGYGNWKDDTFRIANFPAIEDFEIEALKTFFTTNVF